MKVFAIKMENILITICVCIMLVCIITTYTKQRAKTVFLPTAKKVVVIDAGHGGFDPGMLGQAGENEDAINLKIATTLMYYLEQSGSYVIVTRDDENATGSTKREDMANRSEIADTSSGDILISIHQNSYPDSDIKGAQTFYHNKSEEGKRLAEAIQKELKGFADTSNHREVKHNDSYYILKSTKIPAVIVECGFLTNPTEEGNLNTANYQEKIAWSIYMGIVKYFESVEG